MVSRRTARTDEQRVARCERRCIVELGDRAADRLEAAVVDDDVARARRIRGVVRESALHADGSVGVFPLGQLPPDREPTISAEPVLECGSDRAYERRSAAE
jgi:hypothetical protein